MSRQSKKQSFNDKVLVPDNIAFNVIVIHHIFVRSDAGTEILTG